MQVLSYLRGTLLSAGFDWEVIAWDAERLEKIGSMAGHKAPVTAVAQVTRTGVLPYLTYWEANLHVEKQRWVLPSLSHTLLDRGMLTPLLVRW